MQKTVVLKFGPPASPRLVEFVLDMDERGCVAVRLVEDGQDPKVEQQLKRRVSHHGMGKRR
jgi:hypothetical protein